MKFNKWLSKRLKIENQVHEMKLLPNDKYHHSLRSKGISVEIKKSGSKYELLFHKDDTFSRKTTKAGEIIHLRKTQEEGGFGTGQYRMMTSDGKGYVINVNDINNREDLPEILRFFDHKLHYGDEEMQGVD
jgi:hypothetical protein